MKKQDQLSRLFTDVSHFERPFFIFLTLILAGIYFWALLGSGVPHSLGWICLFTFLMVVHISLYWFSPWVFAHKKLLLPFFASQSLIILSICMLSRMVGVTMGLYPGLTGLMIGMPVKRLWKFVAIILVLGLSAFSFFFITPNVSLLWWALATVPTVIFISLYVLLYIRQVEAREQAQSLLKDLEVANRQLSDYAARVEDLTIVNERQRMARELHDTLSQGLAGLILQLEAADAHLSANRPERTRSILQQSMETARETLSDARQAIDNLRHTTPLNLEKVVRQEIDHFTDSTSIPCAYEIEFPENIPAQTAEAVMRIITEGLTNIARHANSSQARVRISYIKNKDILEMEISDDGIGFDPQQVDAGHYGLLGMRERARLVRSSFDINSQAGKGTRIVIRFPLSENGAPSQAEGLTA
jgi:two-component system, NarL family, sensor histidine kinase YdfH